MSIDPNIFKDPEQIKQMIAMLSVVLEQAESNSQDVANKESAVENDVSHINKIKTKGRKSPASRTENKFLSMKEFHMDKEDPELAAKLYRHAPTKRRPKSEMVEAKCRVCGKTEKLPVSLLHGGLDRFKCNQCSSSAG